MSSPPPAPKTADQKGPLRGCDQDLWGEDEVQALFSDLQLHIKKERGALAWVRERPTWLRRVTLFALITTVVGGTITLTGGSLLASPVASLAMLVVALLVTWACTRPMHKPLLRTWPMFALLLICVMAPMLGSMTPAREVADHGGEHTSGTCLVAGLVIGAVIWIFAWVMDRVKLFSSRILGAAMAGTGATLALHASCPVTGFMHLLTGHSSVVFAMLLIAWLTQTLLSPSSES